MVVKLELQEIKEGENCVCFQMVPFFSISLQDLEGQRVRMTPQEMPRLLEQWQVTVSFQPEVPRVRLAQLPPDNIHGHYLAPG